MNELGFLSRREVLFRIGGGIGGLGVASLFAKAGLLASTANSPLAPRPPHFRARARHVIFLCMNGAPSHVDTFDYKPKLTDEDGKTSSKPGGIPGAKLMGSPWKFRQHGTSGLWVSELFPEVGAHAGELGYEAVENPMHIHDLHSTVLHLLLGLDHERLTYRYAGRDMRLTDVKGKVHGGIVG